MFSVLVNRHPSNFWFRYLSLTILDTLLLSSPLILFFSGFVGPNNFVLLVNYFLGIFFLFSLTLFGKHKYYSYKIIIDGNLLRVDFLEWNKKKHIEIDLTYVTIYHFLAAPSVYSNDLILFYEGLKTPTWKHGRIIFRINNAEAWLLYRIWSKENNKELYERMVKYQEKLINDTI